MEVVIDPLTNTFKQRLRESAPLFGLWIGLADAYAVEMMAGVGYDWLLLDGEHAPNDVRSILAQLQAIAPYPSAAVVRPVENNIALIKQYLDVGAQTLLIPMIESRADAQQAVRATRYPPHGVRGVGSALARASRWQQIPDYLQQANNHVGVLLQIESQRGLDNLEEIAKTEGVDGIFFGPSDLAASLGYLGQPGHPQVVSAIMHGIEQAQRLGVPVGILSTDPTLTLQYLAKGIRFVALGVDTSLLVRAASELLRSTKGNPAAAASPPASNGGY